MANFTLGRLAEPILRHLADLLAGLEGGTLPVQYAIVAASSESESYADQLLDLLIGSSPVNAVDFGRALIQDRWNQFFQSWDSRLTWLSRGFELPNGTVEVQRVQILAHLRNSIVHGGGKLTRMQTESLAKQLTLEEDFRRNFDVAVDGGLLIFGDRSGAKGVGAARDFVLHMDTAARQKFSDLPI